MYKYLRSTLRFIATPCATSKGHVIIYFLECGYTYSMLRVAGAVDSAYKTTPHGECPVPRPSLLQHNSTRCRYIRFNKLLLLIIVNDNTIKIQRAPNTLAARKLRGLEDKIA